MQEGRISCLQTWQGQSGKQAEAGELPSLEGGGGGAAFQQELLGFTLER
jgi:hypothetical protein